MAGRVLQPLASSFDPDEDTRLVRRQMHPLSTDRIERGAIAIYGQITGNADFDVAHRKWLMVARERTKARHRAEAEACLRAAS